MDARIAGQDGLLSCAGSAALPGGLRAQLSRRPPASLFEELAWFDLIEQSCAEPGARPVVIASRDGGMVAMLHEEAATRATRLRSWTNFYSCDYAPLLGTMSWPAQAEAFAAALAARRPRVATLALDSMRADRVDVDALAQALRAQGWPVRIRDQPPNRFEHVAGLTWKDYLAARDGDLRTTIARAERRFLRQPGASLRIARDGWDAEAALAEYLDVHLRSWKRPEPHPRFVPGLVRLLARSGRLRLGVASIAGRAIAAQLWILDGRRATIAKLAHDEAARRLSPGTVLTAHMMRTALEAGEVDEVDLGRGDDPYKRLWLPRARPVRALVACNPATPAGLAAAARHLLPPLLRRMAGRAS